MKNLRKNETKFVLLVFLAVAFLTLGGIFVKISELSPIATGFYRILFSIPLLLPFVYKDLKFLNKKEIILLLLSGAFLAGDLILWNISFFYTTVANANLLANLLPITIILACYFMFGEKINRSFFTGLVFTLIGIFILLSGKINPTLNNFFGDFLAFLTSVFYGAFIISVYKLRDKIKATTIMFVSAFGSLIVLFFAMIIFEGVQIPTTFNALLPLLALAIFCQIGGQGILAFCLGKLSANLSSVLVLTQPIIAAFYALFLFKEHLSFFEILGMLISLYGIYFAKKNA